MRVAAFRVPGCPGDWDWGWGFGGSFSPGLTLSPCTAGKLLDATHIYQYVFILAGAEVLASSLVLVLGNFFCIRKRPETATEEERPNPNPTVTLTLTLAQTQA